mmetsp:Transcript_9/g.15  ORF Transcript_9/g.15 Transcript_9/m.15 type:complete len:237 (+) Transcript_9:91-801(+)
MSSTNNQSNLNDAMEAAKMAQQAQQTMHQVSDAIPAPAKSVLQSAKEKILDSDQLRTFSQFFGIGQQQSTKDGTTSTNPPPFSLAFNPTVLCPRLTNNVKFFYLNYLLLTAVVFAIVLLATMLNPMSLIMLAVLALAWFLVLSATVEPYPLCGGMVVTRKVASIVLMIASALVAYWLVKDIFWVTLGSGAALSFVHAALRDAGTEYEIMKQQEQQQQQQHDETDDKQQPFVMVDNL